MDENAQSTFGLSGVVCGGFVLMMSVFLVYGLHRLWEVLVYLKVRGVERGVPGTLEVLPRVTVQIPLYNEANVAERIIRAGGGLDYPGELLQIQVLDDSTDETSEIVDRVCKALKKEGVRIECIRRGSREGYKAGALNVGLKSAEGEYVMIFDADFVPEPDLLIRMIHYFADSKVGMVQAAWGHLNAGESLLTQVQSVYLDGHFKVEHFVRDATGRWLNFNGTGGIWRKSAVVEVGGWECDTLSEDVDLSYRAQLGGWEMCYVNDVKCDGEIPSRMSAFQSQQHRWSKGLIQNAKKHLGAVLKSEVSWWVKLEAFFHLTSPGVSVLVVLSALLVMFFDRLGVKAQLEGWVALQVYCWVCGWVAMGSVGLYYIVGGVAGGRGWWRAVCLAPALIALGIGMSLNNARGVIEAWVGIDSAFKRTPKQGEGKGRGASGVRVTLGSMMMVVLQWVFVIMLGHAGWRMYESGVEWFGVALSLLFVMGFGWVALGLTLEWVVGVVKKSEN